MRSISFLSLIGRRGRSWVLVGDDLVPALDGPPALRCRAWDVLWAEGANMAVGEAVVGHAVVALGALSLASGQTVEAGRVAGKVSRSLSPHGRISPGQEVLEAGPGGVVQVLGRVSLHMAVDECRIELSIVPVLHASFTANQNSVDCA